ncbi:MAG: ABC transporter substrate-binding protein [Treponema sp.]|nr:ABC transporter substrate-binding protein [Treponema sp.]
MKGSIRKLITILIMLALTASVSAKSKTIIKKIKREVINTNVKTISSIVVLSKSAAEILSEMNAVDLITAVSESANIFGEEAAKSVILDGEEDLENIISYKPDLVFLVDGKHRALEDALDERNIEWYKMYPDSIQELKDQIFEIGEMLGYDTEALSVVTNMEERLDEVKQAVAQYYETEGLSKPINVYYEESDDPLSTIGSRCFMHEIIASAGARNIFEIINSANCTISSDQVITLNPDVILIPAANGTSVEEVKAREGWQNISAVKNDRIYIIDGAEYGKYSPLCVDSIYNLFELLK